MMITNQKRMAAQIFSKREGRVVGIHRVWVDPDYLDEVADAVQKADVRNLIDDGIIMAKPIVGTSRSRTRKASHQKSKGRRKGQGSRSGSANARSPRKQRWMTRIRAQRRALRKLRDEGSLTSSQYRHFYLKAKGGSYRSIAHMRSNIELEGIASGGEQ
jgi:large subunit ribosomal protein L19e